MKKDWPKIISINADYNYLFKKFNDINKNPINLFNSLNKNICMSIDNDFSNEYKDVKPERLISNINALEFEANKLEKDLKNMISTYICVLNTIYELKNRKDFLDYLDSLNDEGKKQLLEYVKNTQPLIVNKVNELNELVGYELVKLENGHYKPTTFILNIGNEKD